MIKVENIDYWGFEHAIRGMRNPMNSWDKSDSNVSQLVYVAESYRQPINREVEECDKISSHWKTVTSVADNSIEVPMEVGPNDLDLMRRLYKAGTEHRKYLRQIFVSMDITAPLYWWKEFDTYKVGTVANSCSTMHKVAAKEFELDDFSHEHLTEISEAVIEEVCRVLNTWRNLYLESKNKEDWWQMIQLLPSSYNQRRTITMNYENVVTIIKQRTGHKLDEWNTFVEKLKELPYIKDICGGQE